MKYLFGAFFALAIAAPAAAAQPAAPGHDAHRGHQEHGGQHGQADQGHGQHRPGEGHDCPCCRPGADGQRPACCERMHQAHGARQGTAEGHDSH